MASRKLKVESAAILGDKPERMLIIFSRPLNLLEVAGIRAIIQDGLAAKQ